MNHLGAALHQGLDHAGNYARMVFLAPGAPSFFVDWQRFADCTVGSLRAGAAAETEAPRLVSLVGELSLKSADFAAAWARQDLYEKMSDRKRFQHPLVGALTFDQHVLAVPGSGGHQIWAYHAADDATTEKLGHLVDVTGQRSDHPSGGAAPLSSAEG